MKLRLASFSLVLGPFLMLSAQTANATDLYLKGEQARHLYNSLTGPAIQHDGAAGHLYSKGKNILCRYTDVEMTNHGKSVPATAASRYACSMTFNHNGLASPGPNP